MNKEPGINNSSFYELLSKMIDEPTDNDVKECCISQCPLDQYAVTMECGHTFNYIPLYTEICKQKFIYKTYVYTPHIKKILSTFTNNIYNYYIQCPYCRHVQTTVLPYYPELNLQLHYGVNTINKDYYTNIYNTPINGIFKHRGIVFAKYTVCKDATTPESPCYNPVCTQKLNYCACMPGTTDAYCIYHYFDKIRIQKIQLKQDKERLKLEKQTALKQKRDDKLLQKKLDTAQKTADKIKKFEDKNIERTAQGLKPLKMRVYKNTINNPEPTINEINTVKII